MSRFLWKSVWGYELVWESILVWGPNVITLFFIYDRRVSSHTCTLLTANSFHSCGHGFCYMPIHVTSYYYSTNRSPMCDFTLVSNTNLRPISHRFQVIVYYWSNFRCPFNTFVWGEPLKSGLAYVKRIEQVAQLSQRERAAGWVPSGQNINGRR